MAAENVQTFTDGNFDDSVIKAGQPVLVDFWAEWCGPCKRLAPTVDALATDYAGKVTVGKLNVDDNPNTAVKFQIRGIPALLLFKDGQVVESVVGTGAQGRPQEGDRQAHLNRAGDCREVRRRRSSLDLCSPAHSRSFPTPTFTSCIHFP